MASSATADLTSKTAPGPSFADEASRDFVTAVPKADEAQEKLEL